MLFSTEKLAFFVSVALQLISSLEATAAVFQLNGQVTSGASLFAPSDLDPNISWDEYGAPVGGFPVPFTARLAIDDDEWTFEFTVTDENQSQSFVVGGPQRVLTHLDQMVNQVVRTDSTISIDFSDRPLASEFFSLSLDLEAGTGEWNWHRDCPVCDLQYPLPSAAAVVSGVRAIPEPTCLTLLLGFIALRRNRH